ncbi:hypothetical protein [Pedobacter sp. SYSU D00535]|uniref:hypothetical protein n=1 Tax=Pedobacter sp. SYSU D00535 TaxID=2810308 RepID=UPI001A971B81|nr:hypothetical protein [Pedobacter sp. SYSU D00535]
MTEGNCVLCGKWGPLTFEHIPPQCASNNKVIYVQKHEHLFEENSKLFGKKMRSQRGFGKQTLCASCNNDTGSWYVKDFCEFSKQGLEVFTANTIKEYVRGEYIIKPQNVLKQILMMFVAADSDGAVGQIEGVREYLLNKDNCNFPPDIKIYLYSNSSSHKRLLGYMTVWDKEGDQLVKKQWSEINFKPFGYFLTHNSPPPNPFLVDITDFGSTPFDKKMIVTLTTAHLVVQNPMIGYYKNVES